MCTEITISVLSLADTRVDIKVYEVHTKKEMGETNVCMCKCET